MNYYTPLDSIRAIAVILVIISHWLPMKYVNLFGFGGIGVDIFFVLSGFLITRILLENKKNAEIKQSNKFIVIKKFIIRRTLRIFPIYYLTIILLLILNTKTGTSIGHDYVFYLTYSSNILFFIKQSWDGMLSHLWSLAVEEQFYLIWPWLIIFVNQKYLFKAIIIAFLIGIFSNYIFSFIFPNNGFIFVLTPTCFDAFCLGAILSYVMVYKYDKIMIFDKILSYITPFCLVAFIFSTLFNVNILIPTRTLISICSLYLIFYAIYNNDSILHRFILNNPTLIFIGKISYGVYLYHNIIFSLYANMNYKFNLPILFPNSYISHPINIGLIIIGKFVILIFISWLSWKYIEYPINKFKQRFEYK